MKKFLSVILTLLLMCAVFVSAPNALSTNITDDLEDIVGVYELRSFPTFAETGIPYDEITTYFPETWDVKYENGNLIIKDFPCESVEIFDHLDYDFTEAELKDGYWVAPLSKEKYDAGGYFYISATSARLDIDVNYAFDGKRMIITVADNESYERGFGFQFYPEDGYGPQFVSLHYYLNSRLEITDNYSNGKLSSQMVINRGPVTIFDARYNADGSLLSFHISQNDLVYWYIEGKGWSEDSSGNIPSNPPKGFENATLEELLAYVPTDIGCEHDYAPATCCAPKTCTKCKRMTGEPNGHTYVNDGAHSTCSTCGGILYTAPTFEPQNFKAQPCYYLEDRGFSSDLFIPKDLNKITLKYEDGFLHVPQIDGFVLSAYFENGYRDFDIVNGWSKIEAEEDELEDVNLRFLRLNNSDNENESHIYEMIFNYKGNLINLIQYDFESENDIEYDATSGELILSYVDEESELRYADVYINGEFVKQKVTNRKEGTSVLYGADLKPVYIKFLPKNCYYLPDKGWSESDIEYKPIDPPEGYADKDISYFTALCPTTVDFCVHTWDSENTAAKCTKCGEQKRAAPIVEDEKDEPQFTFVFIIIGVVAVLLCVAVVTIVIVKKKAKASSANEQE